LPEHKIIPKVLDSVSQTYKTCIPLLETDSQDLATSVIPKRTDGVQELDIVHSYVVTVTKAQTTFGGSPLTWIGPQPPQCCEVSWTNHFNCYYYLKNMSSLWVFFGNVPRNVMLEDIIPLFEDFGSIWSLRLVMDPLSTLSRGFGYVNFTTMEAVAVSIDLV
jgi:hypothetical protein